MFAIAPLVAEVQSYGVSLEVDGLEIRARGISQLPSDLLAKLRDHKPNLLAYLQSSKRLLDDAGVLTSYATTDTESVPLLERVLADAADGGPIGLDIETYAPPGVARQSELKLTRTGASVIKPKDDKTGLDPHLAQVRLLQIYGGGDICAVLDMKTVSWKVLEKLLPRKLVIHNSQFELGFFRAQGIHPELVECTMQAAGLMLGVHRRGLAKAAEEYLGWRMPKDLQTSDWGAPKLSDNQLSYAALDAVAALLIWGKLERDLKSSSRWDAYILQRDAVPEQLRWPGAALALMSLNWICELQTGPQNWRALEVRGNKKQEHPRRASQVRLGNG